MSGPLYEFFGHYRPPFLVLAVPTVLMLFAFIRFLPDTRKSSGSPSLSVYLRLFKDRDIWKIYMATFCSLYGFWAAATWGPTFLQAERGSRSPAPPLHRTHRALRASWRGSGADSPTARPQKNRIDRSSGERARRSFC